MRGNILALSLATALALVVPPAGAVDELGVEAEVRMPWDFFECTAGGYLPEMFAEFVDPLNPELTVFVHNLCYVEESHRPGHGSGGGGDCSSHAYSLLSYKWLDAYTAQADTTNPSGLSSSGVLSAFDSGLKVWDAAAAGTIYGGIKVGGSASNVGKQDFVNQFGFKRLGGTTIAQTSTWAFTSTGEAVESDQAYNTQFAWSLSGEANKMDVQNIAAHESGHTFGLGHTSTASANACLTMYPYADYGETQKRTLGPGDTDGIKAKYG